MRGHRHSLGGAPEARSGTEPDGGEVGPTLALLNSIGARRKRIVNRSSRADAVARNLVQGPGTDWISGSSLRHSGYAR
jgi:hypothetical protein